MEGLKDFLKVWAMSAIFLVVIVAAGLAMFYTVAGICWLFDYGHKFLGSIAIIFLASLFCALVIDD